MTKMKRSTVWVTAVVTAVVVAITIVIGALVAERTHPGCIGRYIRQYATWVYKKKEGKKWEAKPTTADMDGIDVSHHNGKIDWKEVAASKQIQFAYAKATEGGTHQDKKFKRNAREARKHGIKIGAYHFFSMAPAQDQFNNYRKMVSKSDVDLIPVIDFEKTYGKTTKQLCDRLEELCTLMEKHYGHKPMIYTSESLYANVLKKRFGSYPMWISRYKSQPVVRYTIWQYSEWGKVKGVGVCDVNKFAKGKGVKDIMM